MPNISYIAILYVLLMLSCSSGRNETPKTIKSDRTFPGKYGSVILYSYDSVHYYSHDLDKVQTTYGGDRMIDTFGTLPKKFFKMIPMDSLQSATLKKFLIERPCYGASHAKTCAPVFRDALIFYDEKGNYMAQKQICFTCRMSSFYGNNGFDMCDFDNKTDWKEFEIFISNIKKQ